MKLSFAERYVIANIPAAFAEAVENDKVVRRYRVIVGKTEKPSPTLTAEIAGFVSIRPGPPSSIAKTEISVHVRKDPGYLSLMHMEVLDGHDNPTDPHSVDWFGTHTPNFGAPAERHLEHARRGQERHAESVFGLHARYQPAQSVQQRLPLRFPRLFAGRQCPRYRRLAVAAGYGDMESLRNRCRDLNRPATGDCAAQEGAGGLGLFHRVDDRGPGHPVPATTSTTRTSGFWKRPAKRPRSSARPPIIH